jgi:hypothetical protein
MKLTCEISCGDPPKSILDISNDLTGMVATRDFKVENANYSLDEGSRDDDFTRVITLLSR